MSDTNFSPNGKKILSRRNLFFGAGAALLAAAGHALYRHVSSTSAVKVESFSTPASGKKKNILVITGSARQGGNSDVLAEAFVKGAREAGHDVNVFAAGRERMSACLHCEGCWSTGRPCVLEDNFEKLWPLLEKADMWCSGVRSTGTTSAVTSSASWTGSIPIPKSRSCATCRFGKPCCSCAVESLFLRCPLPDRRKPIGRCSASKAGRTEDVCSSPA